jgi:C4-dicarboxylate-specific signal transduction histidine kinase
MTDDSSISSEAAEPPAHHVVRRLAARYLIVLAAVAVLMVVDQAVVQPMLVRVNTFAPAINVAGRQRMLSQRLTKAGLALREVQSDAARIAGRDELQLSLQQWTAEHDALLRGNAVLGIRPIRSSELQTEWATLEPHYQAMVAAAGELLRLSGDGSSREAIARPVAALVEHEGRFLPTMDRIVKLMEDEAARAVFRLRAFALSIAVTVVALLVGLGWFVVRPATRTIRTQVDELEARVAQRTSELATALTSLQHEVQERELAELRNQRLSAQLSHAERVTTMGHLTAGLAHELNQPLAAIANYAEACDVLLQQSSVKDDDGRVRTYIDQVKRAALRAGQIVRRMRNFVRPNAVSAISVSLNELVSEIVELCRTESTSAGTEIALDLTATDDVISADPIQVQQVLVNLVQNSLQAMRDNGEHPRRIVLRTATIGDFAQVDVLDNGPGFTSADPEVVFAPFHTTKQDGLGIGLSICRSIVENHRGKIWTEPRPGRGAQVSFTLPLAATHAPRFRFQPDCLCC